MSEPEKPPSHQPVLATILLAMFSSGICFVSSLIILLVNWNNPIWDLKVRIVFVVIALVFLGITIFLVRVGQKRIQGP